MKLFSIKKSYNTYLLILLSLLLLSLIVYEIFASNSTIESKKNKKKKKRKKKMKQKMDNLFNKIKNKKNNDDKTIDEQGVQIKILGEENARLRQDLSNAQRNISGLEEDVEEKNSVIESNKVRTTNLQGKVNNVKTANTELKGDLQNTQEKLAFYETAYNSMITGV